MSDAIKSAFDKLTAAVSGMPENSFAEVEAADVVAVASAIPDAPRVVAALKAGAQAALVGWNDDKAPVVIYQITAKLREMLALVPR